MRVLRFSMIIGLFALGHFMATAQASGLYTDVKLGISNTGDITRGSMSNQNNSGLAANVNVGYMFVPFVGAEMGYTRYPKVDFQGGGSDVDTSYNGYHFAFKGVVPLPMLLLEPYVYGKVGTSINHMSSFSNFSSETSAELFWAGGVGVVLLDTVYSELGYAKVQAGDDVPSAYMASIGVGINF